MSPIRPMITAPMNGPTPRCRGGDPVGVLGLVELGDPGVEVVDMAAEQQRLFGLQRDVQPEMGEVDAVTVPELQRRLRGGGQLVGFVGSLLAVGVPPQELGKASRT